VRYILLLTVVLASNAFAAPDFDETMAAAKQGRAYAQFNLGIMYDNGDGVPENDTEAVKWYRKATDQGVSQAQHGLGVTYGNGEGVPENYVRAYVWLSMAKTQGYENAKKAVETVKNQMTKQQIA
jgi:TPR repeat protein